MTAPELSLEKVKQKATEKTFRASDFLTAKQMEEVHISNAKGKKQNTYDKVDAYIAEIIARFGYQTYEAWKCGNITEEHMVHYIEAERDRERRRDLELEGVLVMAVLGANNPDEHGHLPSSIKKAVKLVKDKQKTIKGGK